MSLLDRVGIVGLAFGIFMGICALWHKDIALLISGASSMTIATVLLLVSERESTHD